VPPARLVTDTLELPRTAVRWKAARTALWVQRSIARQISVVLCIQLRGRIRRRRHSDQRRVWAEEKIAVCQTPPVGDPALRQVMRPIVQHVAALAEGAEVLQPVVGRIAVQVRGCEHDAGHPKPSCLHKVGPPGHAPLAVPPGRRLLVKPPPIRKAADKCEVWSSTALAPTSSALEANVAAQRTPVRRIERPQLRAYGHDYAAFLPSKR
jgi:hypothetical protein